MQTCNTDVIKATSPVVTITTSRSIRGWWPQHRTMNWTAAQRRTASVC